jgi:hypoxanthine phosphoribosyltransferase
MQPLALERARGPCYDRRLMPELLHVDPASFLVDSFRLGRKVYLSRFRPKHAISLWRGGTPVGLGVDAFFRSRGVRINHTTVATDSYTGIAQQTEVNVKNLEHLIEVVCPEDGLLIIDDVYESGNTIRRVVETLRQKARANAPREIVVAAVHHKPERAKYKELPVIALHSIAEHVWIDYPHELADLVSPDDPEDKLLRQKDPEIWRILRGGPSEPLEVRVDGDYYYVQPRELLLDSIRLGVNIAHDESYRPDFLVALWPGGVIAGLPVHEVYKYFQLKAGGRYKTPDHVSVNAFPTRQSYRNRIIGLDYLQDHVNDGDNVLIIDTTFRAGKLVNDVVARLKEVLRRNLTHDRVRVASVYYNPDDRSTWTVRPDIRQPHYWLKMIRKEVIYPHSVHNLPDPHRDLHELNPELWNVLYGEQD